MSKLFENNKHCPDDYQARHRKHHDLEEFVNCFLTWHVINCHNEQYFEGM